MFLSYELSACPLILNSNKVYFASSLIARSSAYGNSNWGNQTSSSNWIFQTGKLQKSSADRCANWVLLTICSAVQICLNHSELKKEKKSYSISICWMRSLQNAPLLLHLRVHYILLHVKNSSYLLGLA